MPDVFDLDSRHPKYEKARGVEADIVVAKIFLGSEENVANVFIDFEYYRDVYGWHVTASKPDFSNYIMQPDDLRGDVQLAIEEELGHSITTLNWF